MIDWMRKRLARSRRTCKVYASGLTSSPTAGISGASAIAATPSPSQAKMASSVLCGQLCDRCGGSLRAWLPPRTASSAHSSLLASSSVAFEHFSFAYQHYSKLFYIFRFSLMLLIQRGLLVYMIPDLLLGLSKSSGTRCCGGGQRGEDSKVAAASHIRNSYNREVCFAYFITVLRKLCCNFTIFWYPSSHHSDFHMSIDHSSPAPRSASQHRRRTEVSRHHGVSALTFLSGYLLYGKTCLSV